MTIATEPIVTFELRGDFGDWAYVHDDMPLSKARRWETRLRRMSELHDGGRYVPEFEFEGYGTYEIDDVEDWCIFYHEQDYVALVVERDALVETLEQWGQPCDDCGEWRPWSEMDYTFTPDTEITAEENRWTCSDTNACGAQAVDGDAAWLDAQITGYHR